MRDAQAAVTEMFALLAGALRAREELGPEAGALLQDGVARILENMPHTDLGHTGRQLAELSLACASHWESWEWMTGAARDLDLDAVTLAVEATEVVRDRYPRPVASLAHNPSDYELVALDLLPGWHNPHKCANAQMWRSALVAEMEARKPAPARWLGTLSKTRSPIVSDNASPDVRRVATDRVVAAVRSGACSPCRRHVPGTSMALAVETAWNIVREARSGGRTLTHDGVLQKVTSRQHAGELNPQEELSASLLRAPVTWTPGSHELSSGQHRLCQARTEGLQQLLVRVR